MKKSIFTLAAIALLFVSCKEVTEATKDAQTVLDSVETVSKEVEAVTETVDSVQTVIESEVEVPVVQ